MAFANNGEVNHFRSLNDYHRPSAIRNVMIRKREALKRIKGEIAQLVEKEGKIEEDLAHLSSELAPHNSYPLPNEILSHVFILVSQDHGPVHFPIDRMKPPPQFVVSHVCSGWRNVALHTSELWSNTRLSYPETQSLGALDKAMYLRILHWQRWLLRAGTFPVTLWINLSRLPPDSKIASDLQDILLPFHVERLHLAITYKDLVQLSTLAETTLPGLTELELDLTLPSTTGLNMMNVNSLAAHHLITRVRSIAFHSGLDVDAWLDKLSTSLPWSQLRSLSFNDINVWDWSIIINILQQIPMLQTLSLSICRIRDIDNLKELAMPALRDLNLRVGHDVTDGIMLDKILRNFTLPSLSKLNLSTHSSWTIESLEILKRQYNMQALQEINLVGGCPQRISLILRNAPVLHTLSVKRNALLDDEAITGISSGTLGRFLRKLTISVAGDFVDEVVIMAEARMKTANQSIEKSCSWMEDIAILKDITIFTRDGDRGREFKKVVALKEAGINITFDP